MQHRIITERYPLLNGARSVMQRVTLHFQQWTIYYLNKWNCDNKDDLIYY